jgi:hypothetical protein
MDATLDNTNHSKLIVDHQRRSKPKRLAAIALVVLTVGTVMGLSSGTASAASFKTPALYCFDGAVHVDPGVRSNPGTTDGYYQIDLYKWTTAGWVRIRSTAGRTSWNQMADRSPSWSGIGSGYFAAKVFRWNAQNGRWVQMPTQMAQTVDNLFGRPTGWYFCGL